MKFYLTIPLLLTICDLWGSVSLDESLNDMSQQIVNSMPEKGGKIAVMDFPDLFGETSDFGKFLSEELITRLFVSGRFEEVIERRMLEQILAEQKLSLTASFDTESIKNLGRLAGVDAIVTGTITDLGPRLRINARIISTETGAVSGAAAVYITKSQKVLKLLGGKIPGRLQVFSLSTGVSIFIDDEYRGIGKPEGSLFEVSPNSHTVVLKKEGFKDFRKFITIGEDEEQTLKVKFISTPFSSACTVTSCGLIIPGSAMAFDGASGTIAGCSGMVFYISALLYLIDKSLKPETFLSKDFESGYDKILKNELYILKASYVTNLVFTVIVGIKHGRKQKVGIEVSSN